MAKYTFLLPAYKGAYLAAMLECIQNQTYTDFNVIISDDCSPEDLFAIVEPFLEDRRFKYRKNEKNIGGMCLVNHWNLLLEEATSEYVIMASDDDKYEVNFLEKMNSAIMQYPETNIFRPLIFFKNYISGFEAEEKRLFDEARIISRSSFFDLCNGTLFSGVSQYVYRRSALLSIGGFVDYPYAWFSDDATVALLSADKGIVIVPEHLFLTRVWGSSISGGKASWPVVQGKIRSASRYYELVKNLSDINELQMADVGKRVRDVSLSLILTEQFINFTKGLLFMHSSNCELFPLSYCLRRFLGRIRRTVI